MQILNRSACHAPKHRTQSGVALITAVFIVAIIVTVTAFLALNQQVWIRQIQNLMDRSQATSVEQGAFYAAAVLLMEDAKMSATDNLNELWATTPMGGEAEGGIYLARAEDAQARFNINNLVSANQPSGPDVQMFRRLLVHAGLDENLAEAVIDWIDRDSKTRPASGAEDTFYTSQQPLPYRAANQPFNSIDELRLVRGFDAPENQEGLNQLMPLITALPTRTTVNINTTSATIIAALAPGISTTMAEDIVKYRSERPFNDKKEVLAKFPKDSKIPSELYDVKTEYFLIRVQTEFGRLQSTSLGLLHRPEKGKQAKLIWRSRQPIIIDLTPKDEAEPA